MASKLLTSRKLVVLALAGLAFVALAATALLGGFQRSAASGPDNSIVVADTLAVYGGTSIVMDPSGKPVVLYANLGDFFTGEPTKAKLLRCGDIACASGNAVTTFADNTRVEPGALQLDSSGNPFFVYTDNTSVNFTEVPAEVLRIMHCNDPACSGRDESIVTVDTGSAAVVYGRIALDSGDIPIVAFVENDGTGYQTLKILRCGDTACSAGNSIATIASNTTTFMDMELTSSSEPVLVFTTYSDTTKLFRCGDATCSSGNVETEVATNVTGSIGLELDTSENPVIAYANNKPDDKVTILHCGNAVCTSGNITAQPDDTGAGRPSLTLDAAGNPVVSYYNRSINVSDLDYGSLRVLHCGNSTCTSANSVVVLQSGLPPTDSSLSLDSSGSPIVVYKNMTGQFVGDIRVGQCAFPNCGQKGAVPSPTPSKPDFHMGIDVDGGGDECDTQGGSTTCNVAMDFPFRVNTYIDYLGALTNYNTSQTVLTYNSIGNILPTGYGASVRPDCLGGAVTLPNVIITCGNGANSTFIGKMSIADFTCTANDPIHISLGPLATFISKPGFSYSEGGEETLNINCIAPSSLPADTDGDSCPDMSEAGTSPMLGGQRSFLNAYDYFDPTHDGLNRIDDVLAVVDQYYIDVGNPGYTADTDRTLVGPNAWNLGAPNGLQRIDDIVNALKHYYHDCS